jgi:CheY-like chemotaxis protein
LRDGRRGDLPAQGLDLSFQASHALLQRRIPVSARRTEIVLISHGNYSNACNAAGSREFTGWHAISSLDTLLGRMTPQAMPLRVLVVDDDAMSRDLLSTLLEGEGHQVECADSGDAALALLSAGSAAPEVVLTDLRMPGTTDGPLADALRHLCGPETLLLAMSASSPSREVLDRFDGFLRKPFTVSQLAAAIVTASAPVAAIAAAAASKSTMGNSVIDIAAQAEDEEAGIGDSPALDERIYSQLAETVPAGQLRQMYGMCMKDARDRIATMRSLAAGGDAAQFIRQAHSIKGGCGMLGATELYAMATRLENSGLAVAGLRGAGGVNPLDELAAACDRLERILVSRI